MTPRRGMTLIELVVAMAVGGAALASGGAVFALLADRRSAMLADAEMEERALAARRQLVAWITEIHSSTLGDALIGAHGTRRTSAGALPDDTLTFVTTAGERLQRVRLFVDRSTPHPALIAEQTADRTVVRLMLASDVEGFEVSFLTSAFGRREWRPRWDGGGLMPDAMVLRLRAADGTALPTALQLPITIPMGAGR